MAIIQKDGTRTYILMIKTNPSYSHNNLGVFGFLAVPLLEPLSHLYTS